MPIPIEEFALPKFIRIKKRYPLSYNMKDMFNEICPRNCAERYRGDVGVEGGWKTAGYNVNHNSITTERMGNIRKNNITLKPY